MLYGGIIMQTGFNTCRSRRKQAILKRGDFFPLLIFRKLQKQILCSICTPKHCLLVTFCFRLSLLGPCVSHTSKMKEIEDGYDKNNTVLPNCAFCCLAILCSLIHILIREVVAENQGVFINTMYFKRCSCSRICTHAPRLFSPALIS